MIPISLYWNDESDNEEAFIVQKKEALGEWVIIGDIAANSEEFQDQISKVNTSYFYRIFAEAGGVNSNPTNEQEVNLAGLKVSTVVSTDQTATVTKSGADAKWYDGDGVETLGNSVTQIAPFGGDLFLLVDTLASVSAIELDDFGIIGEIDLSGFSGLNTFSATNGNFQMKFDAAYIQRAGITINITNSLSGNLPRLIEFFDRLILANGGDLADDGSNYTGSAGNTFASRTLNLGTIVIDISDPSIGILYDKVIALEGKGWTISTIVTLCDIYFPVKMVGKFFAVTQIGKMGVGLSANVDVTSDAGSALDVSLYDNLTNANAGLATGRLAKGESSVNFYLSGLVTSADSYAIRVFQIDGSGNEATGAGVSDQRSGKFSYKGVPALLVCGENADVRNFEALAIYSLKNSQATAGTSPLITVKCGATTVSFYPNSQGILRWTDADGIPPYGNTSSLTAFKAANGGGVLEVIAWKDATLLYDLTQEIVGSVSQKLELSISERAIIGGDKMGLINTSFFNTEFGSGDVELTFAIRAKLGLGSGGTQIVSSRIGGLIAIRSNTVPQDFPLQISAIYEGDPFEGGLNPKDILSGVGKLGAGDLLLPKLTREYDQYTSIVATRNKDVLDFYADGVFISSENVTAYNNYPSPEAMALRVFSFKVADNPNPFFAKHARIKDVLIYKGYKNATEVAAITSLINS